YYLTGFEEPNAVAVFSSDQPTEKFILFGQESDPIRERWEGAVLGQEGAITQLGATQAYPIKQFRQRLAELLRNKQRVYYLFDDRHLAKQVQKQLINLKKQVRSGIDIPVEIHDLSKIVHEMRLIKDEDEIALLRKAANISAKAHTIAMQACKPGMKEYELQSLLEYELSRAGCDAVAYPSIVATGENACVLHYTANKDELKSGDLLLVDAGGEYRNYAADITRTYPVNGKFNAEQKAIYEAVLTVQEKVIASIRPGVKRDVMQELSELETTKALIELGLLQGELDALLKARAFNVFYMHRIGHWLGLDVHDVGNYKVDHEWRELAVGMVLTVEPGIYIPPGTPKIDKRWWGIGVRIEDDILVTAEGCEVLSASVPKTVAEIEKTMSQR
ncbi:MAG TPA: aminopeptidase P N-terminal domain-containing protein, partial [Coxiellaceae bacterium]|nr:aminopeptidase P N-terminal domain-containing protein [Coxiellaceae bacterium]